MLQDPSRYVVNLSRGGKDLYGVVLSFLLVVLDCFREKFKPATWTGLYSRICSRKKVGLSVNAFVVVDTRKDNE
jgi:hypothetical protein